MQVTTIVLAALLSCATIFSNAFGQQTPPTRVDFSLIQCSDVASEFLTDTRDELYLMIGGVHIAANGQVKDKIAKRLPKENDYYGYSVGSTNRWIGVDNKKVSPPHVWAGALQNGEFFVGTALLFDQDNSDIKTVLKLVGEFGKELGGLVGKAVGQKEAGVAVEKLGGELSKKVDRIGDYKIGGIVFVLMNVGGNLQLTEVDLEHGQVKARPANSLLLQFKGAKNNAKYTVSLTAGPAVATNGLKPVPRGPASRQKFNQLKNRKPRGVRGRL